VSGPRGDQAAPRIPLSGAARARFAAMLQLRSRWITLSSGAEIPPLLFPQQPVPAGEPGKRCNGHSLIDYKGELRELLLHTGWAGVSLDGFPEIKAARLRYREGRHNLDLAVFLCPWAERQGRFAVHSHGLPDASNIEHRVSHCAMFDGGYWLSVLDPRLPRELEW
jgi:hypothetical protein